MLIIIDREMIKIYGWRRVIFPSVTISELAYMDPVSLVAYEHVLMTVDILKKIEEKLL